MRFYQGEFIATEVVLLKIRLEIMFVKKDFK
jgi:hypothetical protein